MRQFFIDNKTLLESYFEYDADGLGYVENGEIEEIDIVINDEEKTAEYRIGNLHDDAPYQTDDYDSVCKWVIEHKL